MVAIKMAEQEDVELFPQQKHHFYMWKNFHGKLTGSCQRYSCTTSFNKDNNQVGQGIKGIGLRPVSLGGIR